ncbi:MAG: ferritin [Alphaproteobacteria bacterium]|nr:ferritin [Alphaproteobacteria bacterium]
MAKKIVKVDLEDLINTLNEAYAEEWLAYYQYWLGAKVAIGLQRSDLVAEFSEHANEELKHAGWIANRIIQLGGTPLLRPSEWEEKAHCKYLAPDNFDVASLLHDNLEAERCAITRYESLCKETDGRDYETFRISEKILQEELEHEQELEDFVADLEMSKRFIQE